MNKLSKFLAAATDAVRGFWNSRTEEEREHWVDCWSDLLTDQDGPSELLYEEFRQTINHRAATAEEATFLEAFVHLGEATVPTAADWLVVLAKASAASGKSLSEMGLSPP